jgi:hypothetical protein
VDSDHGNGFVVSHQAAVAAQPRERAFDDPASPNDLEATILVRALDDLDADRLSSKRTCELRPRIAAIGEELAQARVLPQRLLDQVGGAIAILRVGRDYLDREEMAFGVDDRVALDALCLLARIIADRVDRGPPFSVAFATCVSMIAAVGSGSRPHALRHSSSSA